MRQSPNPSPYATPGALRRAIRQRRWNDLTLGVCPGFVQTNLVVLPQRDAFDFLVYAQRNPKACPLIEITDPGDPEPRLSAPGADLRTDLGRYAVCRRGEQVGEIRDLKKLWRKDSVALLIGSSVSFDYLLAAGGIPPSQIWVLETQLPTVPAGRFHGPLIVTMRCMSPAHAILATQITTRFPSLHGAPVHIGDPQLIGANLAEPLFGPPVSVLPRGLAPVFWACGVTPRRAALASKIPEMITHVSGRAFVTDLPVQQFAMG